MKNNPSLTQAMNKITTELINNLEPGEEIELNSEYTLYHYTEEEIIVINRTKDWEEIYQVMTNDQEIIFEKL